MKDSLEDTRVQGGEFSDLLVQDTMIQETVFTLVSIRGKKRQISSPLLCLHSDFSVTTCYYAIITPISDTVLNILPYQPAESNCYITQTGVNTCTGL